MGQPQLQSTCSKMPALVGYGIRDTFGLSHDRAGDPISDKLAIEGYPHPPPGREHFVPAPSPWFIFCRKVLTDLLLFLAVCARGRVRPAFWLKGPTGAGKTSFLLEVAARIRQPVQHIVFHRDMEYGDLLGYKTLIDAETIHLPGPLVNAVRFGDWCVCDEADLANPGTATALNAILDNRPLVIPDNGGEVVPIHERFRLFFTANTGGGGDRSGLYQGTRIQNVALRNRCMFTLVSYPEPDEEMAILDKVTPELPRFAKEKMIAVANDVRRLFMGAEEISEDDYRGDAAPHADPDSGDQPDALEVTISTRTLVLWAEATWLSCGVAKYEFQPHKYALDRVLLMGAEPETRRKVFEVVQRHFGNVPIQGGSSV